MGKGNKNKSRDKSPKIVESLAPNKVKMRFKENKYYNDLNKPEFEAGKVYELEGADWIQRWLKRGGEIVEGQLTLPPSDAPNPSSIVGGVVPPEDPVEPVVLASKNDDSQEEQEVESEDL